MHFDSIYQYCITNRAVESMGGAEGGGGGLGPQSFPHPLLLLLYYYYYLNIFMHGNLSLSVSCFQKGML
jgi:hypothetical protein